MAHEEGEASVRAMASEFGAEAGDEVPRIRASKAPLPGQIRHDASVLWGRSVGDSSGEASVVEAHEVADPGEVRVLLGRQDGAVVPIAAEGVDGGVLPRRKLPGVAEGFPFGGIYKGLLEGEAPSRPGGDVPSSQGGLDREGPGSAEGIEDDFVVIINKGAVVVQEHRRRDGRLRRRSGAVAVVPSDVERVARGIYAGRPDVADAAAESQADAFSLGGVRGVLGCLRLRHSSRGGALDRYLDLAGGPRASDE
mmetsp:Transcript_35864/g.114915  ORF Transcript_35864/g.114915 Transcript_35864/m.114915 type:complete len:252 (-) Transcript_35864:1649-2404(-)